MQLTNQSTNAGPTAGALDPWSQIRQPKARATSHQKDRSSPQIREVPDDFRSGMFAGGEFSGGRRPTCDQFRSRNKRYQAAEGGPGESPEFCSSA